MLIGIVVIAWLVLAGLPFGGERRDGKRHEPGAVDTVTEAPAPPQVTTIVDLPASVVRSNESEAVKTEAPLPRQSPTADAPAAQARKAHPANVRPAAAARPEGSEISGADAEAALREYVVSTNYYRLTADCVRLQNRGYRNVGYTIEVWDACNAEGGSRLGRWRVDAKTREVFRQGADGRFRRP